MNKYLQNMASYISENNPRGVNQVAYKYGYMPPSTKEGREGLIYRGVIEEGDNFFRDLVILAHPDRDLILNADGSSAISDPNKEPNIIDLRSSDPVTIIKENADTGKIIMLVVIAFIFYKILS